jgi:hypothetical protein
LVGRERYEKQDQYHKRSPRVFLLEIRRRFPEPGAYRPDWHRMAEVRGLVAIYYVVLRTVLRKKLQRRRYLARCRHCRIFFIGDPRNAGRDDLGCPFGCADLHRRKNSDKRSAKYNGSPTGKRKRHEREEERRKAEERSTAEGSAAPVAEPAATAERAQSAVPRSAEAPAEDHAVDYFPSSPEASPSATEQVGSTHALPSRSGIDPSAPESGATPVGSGPAEVERIEVASSMVRYIRAVVSLIEGRSVGRDEVLEMLERTERQHSLARERRTEYVLRRFEEEPEKPP